MTPPKKCGAGWKPARCRRVRQVGNLPHTFSSFQGVARDMDDSSENVGQDAILSHEFSSFPGGLIELVNDSSEKVWGRFLTCPLQACEAGWTLAPHLFLLSGRRSRYERLLRKCGTRCHLVPRIFIVSGRVNQTRE